MAPLQPETVPSSINTCPTARVFSYASGTGTAGQGRSCASWPASTRDHIVKDTIHITRKKLRAGTALQAMALIGAGAAAMPMFAVSAHAQEATQSSDDTTEIVVTGSRIARPDLDAPSPVTTVGAEQFDLTGTVTVETLLNDLPQLIPGNTKVSNNQGGEDFSTLDLRGLGPSRTLILVDGERVPPSSTTGVVDIGTIPAGLIDRVDVVTGGASAVYGSDAIAGVVNFILKDNYEGIDLRTQYSVSEYGDGDEFNVQGLFGGNFADGRGNMTVFASYYTREAVSQADRDFSSSAGTLVIDADGVIRNEHNPANYDPANGDTIFASGGSATSPWGSISNNTSNPFNVTFTNVDSDCNPATAGVTLTGGRTLSFDANGNLSPYLSGGRCAFADRSIGSSRYNYNVDNYLVTPYERYTFTTTGRYDLSDSVTFKMLASYVRSEQQVALAPTPATGIVVPYDSPLIPVDLAAALATRPDPTADFVMARRFTETGPRIGTYTSNTANLRGSLQGRISDSWRWDATLSWGHVDATVLSQGNINKTALTQGLNGCPLGSLPGCVAVDIFGENTLTSEMLSFVQIDTKEQRTFEQVRGAANISGTLFELPGGPAAVALGMEVREDRADVVVDDAQRTGNIYGFNAVQNQSGSINVKEIYGEVRLPLLGGLPFIHSLSIEGGIRYSDYSSIGGLTNWKAGAEWAPVSWLRFRGIYNKAARAPSVVELFRNGDQGFYTYTDPCNYNATGRTAATLAHCQADAPGVDFNNYLQANSQVEGFAYGNPDLSEERGETYTIGMVVTPPMPFGNASLTVDYYHIRIDDQITSFGASYFINACYKNDDASACARVTRDPTTGQLISVNTATGNEGYMETEGIDVGLNWSFPLSAIIDMPGRIQLSELFSYVDRFEVNGYNYIGLNESGLGGGLPTYSSTFSMTYSDSRFTGMLRWVFQSALEEDFYGDPEYDPWTPSISYFDLSLSQKFGDNFELTGIVHNLFGQPIRSTPIGYYDQANVDTVTYSSIILGRTFTIAARARF